MNTATVAVTFTTAQVESANLTALRALAKESGITVRHPKTKKPRTAAQYQEALIALIPAPVAVEKPATAPKVKAVKVAKAPKAASPVNPDEAVVILPVIEGVQPEFPRPNTKRAAFLDALRQGATETQLMEIIGTNKASIRQFIYYACREFGKSLGVVLQGGVYLLQVPST